MRFLISISIIFLLTTAAYAQSPVLLSVESLKDARLEECPVCHKSIKPGSISENAITAVTMEAGQYLEEKGLGREQPGVETKGINFFIYRFEERKGGSAGVEKPAGVAFHAHLMDGSRALKTMVFDETQRSLSENLLDLPTFVKRGAKWLTAQELAREGIRKAIDSFSEAIMSGKKKIKN